MISKTIFLSTKNKNKTRDCFCSPCVSQTNELKVNNRLTDRHKLRASVRMSQYLQSWKTVKPFYGLNQPEASLAAPPTAESDISQPQPARVSVNHFHCPFKLSHFEYVQRHMLILVIRLLSHQQDLSVMNTHR